MGGTVAETIRKENGELIKMARKTGAYNWMFFSKDFNNGQVEKAISDHVEKFFEMKRDFESGEPYEFPMSPVYGWCNETAPVDYGLVVIDFQKKKIHSMQGYDMPGRTSSISLSKFVLSDKDTEENYKFLTNNNLLEVHDHRGNYLGDIHTVFGSDNTFDNIQSVIEGSYSPIQKIKSLFSDKSIKPTYLDLTLKSLKDFEIISYEENPDGLVEFITNLKADGFTFDKEEVTLWKEHFDLVEHAYENLSEEDEESFTDEQVEEAAKKYEKEFHEKIDAIVNGNISKPSKKP
jgi:hypothetical protein